MSMWSRVMVVALAGAFATRGLADDAVDPRYPGRYCFWYGSCPWSNAGYGECPAPYTDPGMVPDVVGGEVQSLLWGTERHCFPHGWKNLCCEPLGFVSQDETKSTPPLSRPASAPITITPRPADRSPALDQPVNRTIDPHPADSRPPLGQPSTAPITVHPADPSSLDLPVRKVIGVHPAGSGSASAQPANSGSNRPPGSTSASTGGPSQTYPSGPSANSPPPFGQSASVPIGPHPTGIATAPGSGFNASKTLPPFGLSANVALGAKAAPFPNAPGGFAVSARGSASKSPGNMPTNTGGIYQVHPGGTSTNNSTTMAVKKYQHTKLGKSSGTATRLLHSRNSVNHRRWRAAMGRYRSVHH